MFISSVVQLFFDEIGPALFIYFVSSVFKFFPQHVGVFFNFGEQFSNSLRHMAASRSGTLGPAFICRLQETTTLDFSLMPLNVAAK